MPDISGFASIEVLVGLSFVFLILSTACSAIQEMLASILGWRAKTLEDAVANMLGDRKVRSGVAEWLGRPGRVSAPATEPTPGAAVSDQLAPEVFAHWRIKGLVRDPDSSVRRRARPSYLPPRALSLAVAETLAAYTHAPGDTKASDKPQPTPWEHTDDVIFGQIEATLGKLPAGHTRELLQKAAVNADGDLERFRMHVEKVFDDAMQRATGWYKRRAQLVLTIVAIVFAVGLNVDAVRIAAHLYNDEAVRTAVVAKTSSEKAPEGAADAVAQVDQLQLPVGWGAANAPSGLKDWLGRIPGWIITIAALNLGAPFWFDVLNRLGRKPPAPSVQPAPPERAAGETPAADIDAVAKARPAARRRPPPAKD